VYIPKSKKMAATTVAGHSAASARRRSMLEGPILSTMLRLAAPTMIVLVVQTMVGIAETYFVSFLGTEALAGVALVFPALMLMQMMSNGGFGGGVAAAVARALGAGRRRDADALVLNALVLALLLGFGFTAIEFLGGRWLFGALGGDGAVLAAALAYADVVFAGAGLVWVVSLLAAALRGSGNTVVPAAVILAGAVVLVPLSPALIFGWGPLPRLGVAGAGVAVVVYYLGAMTALIWYLRSGRGALRLPLDLRRLERRLMLDIPPRRRPVCFRHRAGQSHRAAGHRSGRHRRGQGDRRIRHRLASRLRSDPFALLPRHRRAHHGRHQHRCRPDRPRATRRLARRHAGGGCQRDHRHRRGPGAAALARPVQR